MRNFKDSINFKSRVLCQKCQQSLNIIETTRIAKLPKILILSLQKVNSDNTQKTPWIVKFSEEIGIREIVDIDLIKNESCKYKIFAINNHLGSTPKSGHYFSQIFLEELKSWYSFNDESVSKYSDLSPNFDNYILFYKQI
jgi:ubiquitin C-terminal hydrolase